MIGITPVTALRTDPTLPVATCRRASLYWARLLARIYQNRPLACPRCQGEMRRIAFLTEPPAIRTILAHLGEPTTPPLLSPRARAPSTRPHAYPLTEMAVWISYPSPCQRSTL